MARSNAVPLLVGFGLLALVASGDAKAGTPSRPPNDPIDPLDDDEAMRELAVAVCQCAAELGSPTRSELRLCVADRLFPATVWPPIDADPASVKDAWGQIGAFASAYVDDPEFFAGKWCGGGVAPGGSGGLAGGPDGPNGGGGAPPSQRPGLAPSGGSEVPPVVWEEGPSSMPGYPWEAPTIHLGSDGAHVPTPGMFFLVRDARVPTDPKYALDSILGISRYALGSAYAMAGAPRPLGDIPAAQVEAYRDLIACSPWNDGLYGTSSQAAVGGSLGLGPHGRGINMRPNHAANIGRLGSGLRPVRTTLIGGSRDGQVSGVTKSSWPQLWLPPINLVSLASSGIVSTSGLGWSTGDSVLVPPPAVWSAGFNSRVQPPGGLFWGCE